MFAEFNDARVDATQKGPSSFVIPSVIEKTPNGERAYDIYSMLLKNRIVFLDGQVNDQVASSIVAQLFFLEKEDPNKPIQFWINSPGGSVTAGLAIHDAMQFISCPVATICMGQAASMGAFLLAAGEPGMRVATPNARIMIHQASGGAQGNVQDMRVTMAEMERLNAMLMEMMASNSGKTPQEMVKAMQYDNFMSPASAVEFGLIDQVQARPPAPGSTKLAAPSAKMNFDAPKVA